jgi:hypothetical protein
MLLLVNQGNTMATPSSYSSTTLSDPRHPGVERVLEGAQAIKDTVREVSVNRRLPSYMTGITVMIAVTLTARALDDSQTGFFTELVALSAAALFAFVFLSSSVRMLTRGVQRAFAHFAEEISRRVIEERNWRLAEQDPRVMNDILWAQRRDNAALVDEARGPTHASQREILADRRGPSPVFVKYY